MYFIVACIELPNSRIKLPSRCIAITRYNSNSLMAYSEYATKYIYMCVCVCVCVCVFILFITTVKQLSKTDKNLVYRGTRFTKVSINHLFVSVLY